MLHISIANRNSTVRPTCIEQFPSCTKNKLQGVRGRCGCREGWNKMLEVESITYLMRYRLVGAIRSAGFAPCIHCEPQTRFSMLSSQLSQVLSTLCKVQQKGLLGLSVVCICWLHHVHCRGFNLRVSIGGVYIQGPTRGQNSQLLSLNVCNIAAINSADVNFVDLSFQSLGGAQVIQSNRRSDSG